MDLLLIVSVIALLLLFMSYNHVWAIKALRRGTDKAYSNSVADNIITPQEMCVRAVKAYTLGEYIVVTTVLQKGGSRRSIDEVVVDEPSLLVPLVSISGDSDKNEK